MVIPWTLVFQLNAPVDNKTFLTRTYKADTFVYNIDIVGTCNLRCASCPVGNVPSFLMARGKSPKGFMPYEHFASILAKILRESPVSNPVIALYNWGEPLLHPEIGRIVELVRSYGLYCAVSTNLNQIRFLDGLVRAGPSNIKISLSGFTQQIYSRTHNRGNVELVKQNMLQMRMLADKYGQPIDIFIGYHNYIDNVGEEFEAMETFARELGFGVRRKIARLFPLEKALPLCQEGAEPDPADRILYEMLLVKPAEWSRLACSAGYISDCVMRTQEMTINYDGSVSLCCNVFDYSNNVADDFLLLSHDDLQERKCRHQFCGPCLTAGYPNSCNLDAHPEIQAISSRRASFTAPMVSV